MFELYVNKTEIFKNQVDVVTSGAKKAFDVKFEFSGEWEGFIKTICFCNKDDETIYSSVLNNNGKCEIPYEVTKNAENEICIGVYGVKGDVVLPTIWSNLCIVEKGAEVGDEPQEATPSAYEQMLFIAQNLQNDANSGKFNGYTPVKGTDYFTQAEIDDIKKSITDDLSNQYGDVAQALDEIIELQNELINK